MNKPVVIALVLVLAGCGSEQYQDLKDELRNLTKDLRGNIKPLPVVKPYEPVPYSAADQTDPFNSSRIEVAVKTGGGGKLKPDQGRPKEPLESFPLESLKMVGTLEQQKQTFALVRADASLYRVKVGAYMGQNFGVITEINENEIKLRELVQDAGGDWTERVSSLQLQQSEAKR